VTRQTILALLFSTLACAPSPAARTASDGDQARTQPQETKAPQTRIGRPFEARVVVVADGDTLELIPSGESQPIRIRLEGIDAPELNEAFGREATTYTRRLLNQQRVRVEGRDVDGYGRLVARVFVGGRDASRALLEAGLACHFTRFANDPVLATAERQARAARQGFWSPTAEKPQCTGLTTPAATGTRARTGPDRAATASRTTEATRTTGAGSSVPANSGPPAPGRAGSAPHADRTSTARENSRPRTAAFRGNVNSRLYHAPTCPNATCRNCTRLFSTEAEARAAGFMPAGDCLRR
jgi:endonuclease YncB( thermonuclease family)